MNEPPSPVPAEKQSVSIFNGTPPDTPDSSIGKPPLWNPSTKPQTERKYEKDNFPLLIFLLERRSLLNVHNVGPLFQGFPKNALNVMQVLETLRAVSLFSLQK